jgi:hypothetical protein
MTPSNKGSRRILSHRKENNTMDLDHKHSQLMKEDSVTFAINDENKIESKRNSSRAGILKSSRSHKEKITKREEPKIKLEEII